MGQEEIRGKRTVSKGNLMRRTLGDEIVRKSWPTSWCSLYLKRLNILVSFMFLKRRTWSSSLGSLVSVGLRV